MKALPYIIMCIPAAIMTVAGIAISLAKRDSTMIRHHHAKSFNIKSYSKKVIPLFIFAGVVFSLGGILLIRNMLIPGIVVMLASLVIFIVRFAIIQKKQ